ncbi:unnamed protein product [Gadus morhua 'NCC']
MCGQSKALAVPLRGLWADAAFSTGGSSRSQKRFQTRVPKGVFSETEPWTRGQNRASATRTPLAQTTDPQPPPPPSHQNPFGPDNRAPAPSPPSHQNPFGPDIRHQPPPPRQQNPFPPKARSPITQTPEPLPTKGIRSPSDTRFPSSPDIRTPSSPKASTPPPQMLQPQTPVPVSPESGTDQ